MTLFSIIVCSKINHSWNHK